MSVCIWCVLYLLRQPIFFVNLKFNRWFSDLLLKAFLYVHKSWQGGIVIVKLRYDSGSLRIIM